VEYWSLGHFGAPTFHDSIAPSSRCFHGVRNSEPPRKSQKYLQLLSYGPPVDSCSFAPDLRCLFSMSQRPLLPPPRFTPSVSFNLSQRGHTHTVHLEVVGEGGAGYLACRRYKGSYHIMSRGDRQEAIYRDQMDCESFLETLGQACERTGWLVHCLVLMGNHWHGLIETPEPNLSIGMKWLHSTYTQRFNRRHKELTGELTGVSPGNRT